jgi:CheY-like chemotaxis protein
MRLTDATVLIVDDEIALRTLLKRWFVNEGCGVLTAVNGAEALELATANEVDLIVTDIRMPIMDGIELARRLKERGRYFPKIVFITGFGDVDDRETFDLGVEAKVSKPFRREALASLVRQSLMNRADRWREIPTEMPEKSLDAVFPGFACARRQGLIAFGRGGFCIRSGLAVQIDEPILLHVEFAADRRALVGQGIVRWAEPADEQIGIEITYVDDPHRAWVAQLAERNESMSFIPRSSAAEPSVPGVTS